MWYVQSTRWHYDMSHTTWCNSAVIKTNTSVLSNNKYKGRVTTLHHVTLFLHKYIKYFSLRYYYRTILTCYGLDSPDFEHWWGARSSVPIHTSAEAHPASCTTGNRFLFHGWSSQGAVTTVHPLLAPRLCMGACYSVTFTIVCKWYSVTPVTRHPGISLPHSIQ